MKKYRHRKPKEPTIALINIVFLMLLFFMVAGTLSQPLDGDLDLVRTADMEGTPPPDTLVVHPDGRLSYRGETIDDPLVFFQAQNEEEQQIVRLVPDRDLPAQVLVNIARDLRAAGAQSVLVVTERGLQ